MKVLSLCALLILAGVCLGQDATEEKGPWWPHPIWGAGDQAGGSNWITPEKVLEAISLVKTGKIYEIGQIYEAEMPVFGGRSYSMLIPGAPTVSNIGKDKQAFFDEFLCTQIGQIGTQFDGPGHFGGAVEFENGTKTVAFYNGFTLEQMASSTGLLQLGVENVKPYIVPAILIDIAGYKDVVSLKQGYEVTVDDVKGALKKQGMSEKDVKSGNAILFNYGHSKLWKKDPVGYYESSPGIGLEVGEWVIGRNASMMGSDSPGTEVVPNPDPDAGFPVHLQVIAKAGIWNLENLVFDEILKDDIHEFMLVFTPTRFKGATGSPGRPIAVV